MTYPITVPMLPLKSLTYYIYKYEVLNNLTQMFFFQKTESTLILNLLYFQIISLFFRSQV